MFDSSVKKDIFILENQQIMLDKGGYVIENNGKIINVNKYKGKSLVNVFPFLESIFNNLLSLELNDPEIRFKSVEYAFDGKLGLYNYSFIRIQLGTDDHILLWSITNITSKMELIKERRIKKNLLDELELNE
jgi:hypothetical protein